MEEKEEKKVNAEELKSEASTTVNQVKDTIKNVDIKKDSIETKGFISELFKDPLGKIKEIVEATSGRLLRGDPEEEILNISTDSREVLEQALFIPIIGEKLDGHDFMASAFENGYKSNNSTYMQYISNVYYCLGYEF